MNLKFKYKQSSEFKGSNKDCLKLYILSSVTAVWTYFLQRKKKTKHMEEELKNWETKNSVEKA